MNEKLGGELQTEAGGGSLPTTIVADEIKCGAPVVLGPAGLPPSNTKAFEAVDTDPNTTHLTRPTGAVVMLRDGSKGWIAAQPDGSFWIPIADLGWLSSNLSIIQQYIGLLQYGSYPQCDLYVSQPSEVADNDYFEFSLSPSQLFRCEFKRTGGFTPTPGAFTVDISDLSDGDGVPTTIQTRLKAVIEANSPIRMSADGGDDPNNAQYVNTGNPAGFGPKGPSDQANMAHFASSPAEWTLSNWYLGTAPWLTFQAALARRLAESDFDTSVSGPVPDDETAGGLTITFKNGGDAVGVVTYSSTQLKADADAHSLGGSDVGGPVTSSVDMSALVGVTFDSVDINAGIDGPAPWAFGADSFDKATSQLLFQFGSAGSIGTIDMQDGSSVSTPVAYTGTDGDELKIQWSLKPVDAGGEVMRFVGLDPTKTYEIEGELEAGEHADATLLILPDNTPVGTDGFIEGIDIGALAPWPSGAPKLCARTPDSGLMLAASNGVGGCAFRARIGRQMTGTVESRFYGVYTCDMVYADLPPTGPLVTNARQWFGIVYSQLVIVSNRGVTGHIRLREVPI